MVEFGVVLEIVTVCVEVKVPPAGLKVGVAVGCALGLML